MDHEQAAIEGIKRGLADLQADRTVNHEGAMASVRHAIAVATAKKKAD
tara:strand:- start:804 stop:947 length:144 start_codon:yes stop_codon:yes gene_type:complete